MGLSYDGLEVNRDGLCKGAFHVKSTNAARRDCSHGPDVAPATMTTRSTAAPLASAPAPVVCDGDGTSGKRVQVIYAHPSTVADRYASYKASFQQWAADADADFNVSGQQTGDSRHVRYVTDAGCLPVVLDVALSASGASDFASTINELDIKGYNHTDRRYMVFIDATVYCGISDVQYDDQPGAANANNNGAEYARIDSGCWSGVIAAHELMHTLGGVQLSAPHSDGNWHCSDGYDNMCDHSGHAVTLSCSNSAGDSWFDCNHDDYFSTKPAAGSYLATHWNTANSQFLINAGAPAPVSPTPSVNSMQTGRLSRGGTFTAMTAFNAGNTVTARAHVVDQNGSSLSGASVTLAFKRPNGTTQCTVTAASDASGVAQASCGTSRNALKGSWTVHLANVALSGSAPSTSATIDDYAFTIQ